MVPTGGRQRRSTSTGGNGKTVTTPQGEEVVLTGSCCKGLVAGCLGEDMSIVWTEHDVPQVQQLLIS